MGYTILLQWSFSVPGRQLDLTDIVLARVLERYTLVHPVKSKTSIRTYRSTFPSPSDPTSSVSQYLTTLTHAAGPAETCPEGKDGETAYLFLDDRSPRAVGKQDALDQEPPTGSEPTPKENGAVADTQIPDAPDGSTLDEDGFEIVDRPPEDPIGTGDDNAAVAQPPAVHALAVSAAPAGSGQTSNFSTLAVRPASNVLPMLQQLMSPFVIGLTKAARVAASTTQEAPAPTFLPGAAYHLTTHTFPALSPLLPPLALTVHAIPNANAGTIFLEAEWQTCTSPREAEQVLREFLDGCLPEGVGGETRFLLWADGGKVGWEGTERTRRTVHLLLRALREGSFI